MLFDDLIPAGPASSAEPKGDRAGPGATGLFDDLVPAGATMGQAFGRGVDLMQGMLYGGVEAVGEAVGSESVAEWGRAGRERNVEEAAQYPQRKSVFDVGSVGDAVDYGADLVAEQAPMMAPPLAGAAVGAAAGGLMAGPPGAVVGGILGAAAPSFVMGTGEVQGAIKEKDPDAVAPGYALTGGAAIAALDTVLPGKIGSRIARSFGIGPAELVAEHVVKRIATEGGKAMVTEGITEAVQEVIAEATAAQATGQALDENWWKNAVEAGVAGAIIGGGVGGATAALPQGKATPAPSQGETVGETPAVDLDPDPERLDSPYVTPEDRASPIPTADIDDGKKIVADVLGETPSGEPATAPEAGAPQIDIPAPVRAVLRKAGNTDEDIDIMSTAERRAELFAAFEAGVVPTPEEIDAAGTYAAPQAQAPAQPGGLTKEGVFGPRVGASADLSRAGEITAAPQGTAGTGVQPSPAAPQPATAPRPDLEPLRRVLGRPIDDEWVSFSPESGTLAVPRSEMPQIRTIHRGAMVNFLNARGVAHREQDIPARDLKPTQGEFSRKKVRKAQEFEGSDRKILVSSDGYVLDGHHQWMAKLADNGDVGAIVLDAPIRDLISLTREFPSSTFAKGAEAGAVEAGAAGRPQAVLPQAAPTGTETVDLAPRPTLVRQRRAPAGKGIIGFIRSMGGLKPDAELDVMELRRARPGTISKKGLDLDSMREAAAEAGYFDHLYGTPERAMQMSTPRDLLDLIDGELRGDVALDAQDRAESDPLAMTPAQQSEQEEALSAAREQIDEILDEYQFQIPDDIRARAELYIATGEETDPELAIERAAIMLENDERGTNAVVGPLDIPGWMDDEIQQSGTSPARPGTGPGRGEADRTGEGGKTATTGAQQKGARADGTESRDQEDARLTRAEIEALVEQYLPAGWTVDLNPDESRVWLRQPGWKKIKNKPLSSGILNDRKEILDTLKGMRKTMGGQAKRPARESSYGKSNKIFTEDEADLAQSIVYPKGVATPPPGPSATQPRPSAIIRTTPQDAWRPTDDYRPDPGKSQFANARDFVVEQGKIDGVEHMLFFSAEGELLVEGKGEKSRINFAPEVVDALNDPSQNLVMHHNHPGSRSLSVDDLLTLTYPGAEVVHAHGHNGAHYEARLADRLKPYRIPRTKIKPALTAMVQKAVETADNILQPQLQRLINARQLSVDEAEIIHAHIVNLALADAGLITYASNRTDVSLDDARWSRAVQDAISDVRQQIEEFVKNAEQDLHAVRRSPEPVLREPGAGTGGVEGVSEGDQGAPRYDPQQGGRGGERRQTNRLLEGPSSPFQIAARVARLAPSLPAVRASLGRSIMRGIKRRPDDQETIGAYAHRLMIDYLDPVKQMVESVGGTVQDTMNAYLLARLAEDATLARIQGLHDQFVTPAVEALAKVGATLEDLHDFLYARHAPERNRVVGLRNAKDSDFYAAVTDHDVVGASGWSTNEAKRVLRDLAKDPEKFAGIREAARLIRQMLDKTLADQLAAGLISQETYDELTTQWKHYVPLKADDGLDSRGDFAPHRGRGFDVRGDEFKGATGRFTEAENIVAWAVSQSERAVLRAEHNNVGKAVLRFINHFDPGGDFLAKVYWTGEDELGDIEKAPTVYRREIGRDGMVHNRKVPPSTIAPDMFAAKVGGKTFYVKFADERVGLALKKMNAADLNFLFRLARKWTNFQSLINTRANPAFVPINIIRDAMTGAIHLLDEGFSAKEAAKIVAQIPRAWGALWRHMRGEPGTGKWDEALKEYIAAGGKITFEPHKTLEDSIKELQKRMAEAVNGKSRPKAIWDAFVKFVGDINDAGENGMRLAAYAAAREKGRTAKQAAFMARDLTVDFKKHGEAGPAFNSFYVFFNASIQGNYNIAARLVKSKTVRRAVYLIALQGILVDFLNRALSGDDDDGESYYEKMLRNEPWKFERQMVIFTGPGADDYFSVPLPYGYNAIYHMGLQAAAAGHGTVEPMEAIANAARVTFDAFNPIGSGGTMWNLIMPTALDPFIEITANRSFTGAPISPTRYPGDISPDSQRYFQSTPDWARDLAGWMNAATGGNEIEPGLVDIAPDTIEHMWGYVSGGIGRFFGQVVDTGKRLATGDEIEPENVPWVRSFYGRFDDDGKRAEYYRMREEVQIAKERLKDYAESGDREATSAFIERNRVAIDSIKVFDQIEKRLRKIRKAKRAIDFDKDLTRAQKDLRLKPLEEAEITHMNAARQAYARNRRAQQ